MASGASSIDHFLEAVLLDAVDADGAALTSDPAEEYVRIDAGTLALLEPALPDAEAGRPYAAALEAEGGQPPYSWSITSSNLPPQLTVWPSGLMEGTPQAAQACSIHVVLRDATQNGSSVEADVSLRILAPHPRSRRSGWGSQHSANRSSRSSNPPADMERRHVCRKLTAGLTLQGSRITGTVSAERSSCDVYNVTLRLEDEVGRSARETFQMVVLPGRLIEVSFSAPGAILAAPNLLLTEYNVAISASAGKRDDPDTRAVLESAMDDILAEIAGLLLGSGLGPSLPYPPDPHNPVPGGPGNPPAGGHPGVANPPGPDTAPITPEWSTLR